MCNGSLLLHTAADHLPEEIFFSFLNNYFHHYIISDVMCLKFCSPTDSVLLWERSAYRSTRRFTTVRNLTYALSINAGMHQISALRQTCLSHAPSANRSIYQARPCMPSGGSPGAWSPLLQTPSLHEGLHALCRVCTYVPTASLACQCLRQWVLRRIGSAAVECAGRGQVVRGTPSRSAV